MNIPQTEEFVNQFIKSYPELLVLCSHPLRLLDLHVYNQGENNLEVFQNTYQKICSILTSSLITEEVIELEFRYTLDSHVFLQDTVDYGWISKFKNHKKEIEKNTKLFKKKIVIYFCNEYIGAEIKTTMGNRSCLHKQMQPQHIIGQYWDEVHHIYIADTCDHPFTTSSVTENKSVSDCGLEKNDLPLVTVVTVVFNGEKFIEQTIQSVISQSYPNFEYIIVDGGSTDKTIDIIKKYQDYIDLWVSENDEGIYDAMNKGFNLAKGMYINFMNVGDVFYNNSVIKNLQLSSGDDSVCGINLYFSNITEKFLISRMNKNNLPHQALFMNRSAFSRYKFDTKYQYSGDGELWCRLMPNHKIINSSTVVSLSRFGGVSSSSKYLIPRMQEHLQYEKSKLAVLKRFLPKILLSKIFTDSMLEKFYFLINGQPLKILPDSSAIENSK
jgi:hypothetical protein